MGNEKNETKIIGLIPFSREKVKVGDRILTRSLKYVGNYIGEFKFYNLDQRYIDTDKYVVSETNCGYIDRRPRYKRVLDSVFGIR